VLRSSWYRWSARRNGGPAMASSSALGSASGSFSTRASAIASSIASFVPEPIEKCAVCAASPMSTTFS
jgi:hypothetical protein